MDRLAERRPPLLMEEKRLSGWLILDSVEFRRGGSLPTSKQEDGSHQYGHGRAQSLMRPFVFRRSIRLHFFFKILDPPLILDALWYIQYMNSNSANKK